jgi:hypothetical protein
MFAGYRRQHFRKWTLIMKKIWLPLVAAALVASVAACAVPGRSAGTAQSTSAQTMYNAAGNGGG